jgi:hypothetical protein
MSKKIIVVAVIVCACAALTAFTLVGMYLYAVSLPAPIMYQNALVSLWI